MKATLPERKNLFNISPDEEPFYDRAPTRAVAHVVHAKCAAIPLLEGVSVILKGRGIGAAQLYVNEAERGFPLGDLGGAHLRFR